MTGAELTKRERQVLQAIADFGSDAGAAEALDIQLQTVKNHTLNVRKKMEAKSTLQAIYRLMRDDGYIEHGWDDE